MTRVKICGITCLEDAREAARWGADAIGFVFADSPRRIDPDAARAIADVLPARVKIVGVFADAPPHEVARVRQAAALDCVQLHGQETPEYCAALGGQLIKRFNIVEHDATEALRQRMHGYHVAGYLLDPGGGDGRTFDWRKARGLPTPLIVAGGLTPENVGDVIRLLRPYGVDVSSGVEAEPGRKDPRRVRAFLDAVRSADAALAA